MIRRRRKRRSGLLWVTRDDSAPHPYLVASARRAGEAVREIHWAVPLDGERSFGRFVELRGRRHREHPMSVKAVSPRLLAEFVRAPEDVLVILRAWSGRAVRRSVQAVPAAQGGLPRRGGLPPHRPDRLGAPQGRPPSLRGAVRRRVRGQQPAREGLPGPDAQRRRRQDRRRLVAGGLAGRSGRAAAPMRPRPATERRCSSAPAASSPRRASTC